MWTGEYRPQDRIEVAAPRRWLSLMVLAGVVALMVAGVWALLQTPVDVPDTSSPPVSNHFGTANDWTSVGQTFVPKRNGLDRISVVLATEQPDSQAAVTFRIKESPRGDPLRTVKRTISSFPVGEVGSFRPGTRAERWTSFDFQPIPDSAGRELYFSIEGKDVPRENTVNVLMYYHNGYPLGEAYLNEKPADAHVVFRASSAGNLSDGMAAVVGNLVVKRSGPLGNVGIYLAVALLYVVLAAAAMGTMGRTG